MTAQTQWSAHEIATALNQPPPTDEQRIIIEAPLEPMLVVAGAGSGKTETMSARVIWLIANGLVRPEQILGLTFTRKAAGELAHRIRQRLGQLSKSGIGLLTTEELELNRPHVVTYNSYAANLVREHGLRIGIEPDSTLMTDATGWQMAAQIVENWQPDLRIDSALSTVTGAVISLSDSLSEHLVDLIDARAQLDQLEAQFRALPVSVRSKQHTKDVAQLIARVAARRDMIDLVEAYRERKKSEDLVSFSDQIEMGARLARQVPKVRAIERARFPVVLLDEYQDTSYAQVELLAGLFGQGHAVTAVGDPHQSIYGWRGASPSGLGRFPERFPRADAARAAVHSLSISWRNDAAILEAANLTAAPLRESSRIHVDTLATRPAAGRGQIIAEYHATIEDEARAIAEFLQPRHAQGKRCAVLCRNRQQFLEIEMAVRAIGLPVEVVGLGGLLDDPAVSDITSLLTACHDLSRGDALMRLLTGPRFAIGPYDLAALTDRAAELDDRAAHTQTVADAAVEDVSIIEALDSLPASADWTSYRGRSFSEAGLARLRELAGIIDSLRAVLHQPLVDVVIGAERALGLDIEMLSLTEGSHGRIRLDAFHDVATNFSTTSTTPSLGAFLAWLDAARAQERGLDRPTGELDPNAVQLITIHGAKGLEWDVVAVAGLMDGRFPSPAWKDGSPSESGWLSGLGNLPWPLRGDAKDLPALDLEGIETNADTTAAVKQFRTRCGHHAVAEERRLAYVAYTRAKEVLYVSGAWWREASRPVQPSPFYTELVEAGIVQEGQQTPPPDADAVNPLLTEPVTGQWPPATEHRPGERVNALEVITAMQTEELTTAEPWRATAELLVAEHQRAQQPPEVSVTPSHVTASSMVSMSKDSEGYLKDLRRPVPQRPSQAARRGTAFHLWIEKQLGAAGSTLFDFEDLESFDDSLVEHQDIAHLQEQFLASPWASRQPFALEQQIDMVLSDVPVRMKIDAIFADEDGGYSVVDWKSGRQPASAAEREHVSIQLALYRLAWSQWAGVPQDLVRAYFFYAADGVTVAPERDWSIAELSSLIPRQPRA